MMAVTYATMTNDCKGIVGSFSTFQKELEVKGFAGKRIRITYEIITLQEEEYERDNKILENFPTLTINRDRET